MVMSRVRTGWSALFRNGDGDDPDAIPSPNDRIGRWETNTQRLDVLDAYYLNNDLYKFIARELKDAGYVGIFGIRNPANRVVELYAAKLRDKLRELLDAPDAIKPLILRVWEWSNWIERSEEAARSLTTRGTVFVKVESVNAGEENARLQYNVLDPRTVVEFDVDGRDILTLLRLDTVYEDDKGGGEFETRCVTEVWDKAIGLYQRWDHELDFGAPLDEIADVQGGRSRLEESAYMLAEPPEDDPTADVTGYDFVPVVYRTVKRVAGELWGRGVFEHALDPIDELNRQATKLALMMFPDWYTVIERDPSARGGDLGPMKLENEDETRRLDRGSEISYRVVTIEGAKTIRLVSGARISFNVPPIDFEGHVSAMSKFDRDLEEDLPELAYYRLRALSEPPSGVAARTMLADVIDRVGGARTKFEDMIVRLDKMALSIGKALSIAGFENVPEYESGGLDHKFRPYDIFPLSRADRAAEVKAEADALAALATLPERLQRKLLEALGYEAEDIETIVSEFSQTAQNSTPNAAAQTILQGVQSRRSQTIQDLAALRGTASGAT